MSINNKPWKLLEDNNKLNFIDLMDVNNTKRSSSVLGVLGPVPLPISVDGNQHFFNWYVFRIFNNKKKRVPNGSTNSLLVYGNIDKCEAPLVRLHSSCHTGDVLGSLRCECGPQLKESLKRIINDGAGAILYLTEHEGRGIGLWAKAAAYSLQDMGLDTYQANEELGFPPDARDYYEAANVLKFLLKGKMKIRLLSNNPLKLQEMKDYGFKIIEMVNLVVGVNNLNINYLKAKNRSGHTFSSKDLENNF